MVGVTNLEPVVLLVGWNRLRESKSFTNLVANQWGFSGTYNDMYYNSFAHDANGNITQQIRLSQSGQKIEDMVYRYKTNSSGKLLRNRLYHINDEVDASDWADDIDDMGVFENNPLLIETANNYSYDEEGRLIKDTQEGIKEIVWRVDGKVRAVIFDSLSQKPHLLFDYDAFGRRIAKHLYDNQSEVLMKTTYYLRDASGNQLSTYVHEVLNEQTHFTLKELHLYGSSHLGMVADSANLFTHTPSTHINTILGLRYYNLSNHLGNVLTTLSDIKIPLSDDNQTVSGYDAAIVNIYDYSPFGVYLDGRTIESKYMPFGFNGMQRDDELKGMGNSYDFGARMYDSRLGRFLSLDAFSSKFPDITPFSFAGNMPIWAIDDNGDSIRIAYSKKGVDYLYTYGSKEKIPNSRFVKKTVRTLDKLVAKGRDPIGIINFLAQRAGDDAVITELQSWYSTGAFTIQIGKGIITDAETEEVLPIDEQSSFGAIIAWHTKSGYISSDFETRQSSSTALLHELGHLYYDLVDPRGEQAAWDAEWAHTLTLPEGEREAAQDAMYGKKKETLGEYHTYSDRWLIQEVEPGTGEGTRKNHSDGYFLKTRGGTFSTRGNKIGKSGEEGTIRGTKSNSIENGGNGKIK